MTLSERIMKAAGLAAPIYAAHGWTWRRVGATYGVPDVGAIAMTIRKLHEDALAHPKSIFHQGRLHVQTNDDGEVSVYVQLGVLRESIPVGRMWGTPDEIEGQA